MAILRGVGRAVGEVTTAWAAQERATVAFGAAISRSGQLTSGASTRLMDFAKSMAAVTGSDRQTILSLETFLSTAGRTEDQIKRIVAVASDMSVATGTDLDSAVRTLNKSFGGLAGELGEAIPEIKTLTAEQLRAGGAVDFLAGRYKGLSDALKDTTDVQLKNFKVAWEETKANLGAAVVPVFMPIVEWLRNLATGWNKAAEEKRRYNEVVLKKEGGQERTLSDRKTEAEGQLRQLRDKKNAMLLAVGNDSQAAAPIQGTLEVEERGLELAIQGLAQSIAEEAKRPAAAANPVSVAAGIKTTEERLAAREAVPVAEQAAKAAAAANEKAAKAAAKARSELVSAQDSLGYMKNALAMLLVKSGDNNEIGKKRTEVSSQEVKVKGLSEALAKAGAASALAAAAAREKATIAAQAKATAAALGPLTMEERAATPVYANFDKLTDFMVNLSKSNRKADLSGEDSGAASKRYASAKVDFTLLAETMDLGPAGKELSRQITAIIQAGIQEAGGLRPAGGLAADIGRTGPIAAELPSRRELRQSGEENAATAEQWTPPRPGTMSYAFMEAKTDVGRNYDSIGRDIGSGLAGAGQAIGNVIAPAGGVVQAAGSAVGGGLGALAGLFQPIMPVLQSIGGFLGPIASVQAILKPVTTILKGVMEVLGPSINSLLKPLVGILKIVGQTLGKILVPALNLLTPVIEFLVNVFIDAYNMIAQFITDVTKGWIRIDQITKADVNSAGDAELAGSGGSGGSGGSTTYEKQRDITVNVTVNTPALVGEGGFREFCVMVQRELKSTNALGLA